MLNTIEFVSQSSKLVKSMYTRFEGRHRLNEAESVFDECLETILEAIGGLEELVQGGEDDEGIMWCDIQESANMALMLDSAKASSREIRLTCRRLERLNTGFGVALERVELLGTVIDAGLVLAANSERTADDVEAALGLLGGRFSEV